ncbi:hypothetical protein BD779DRAFT_1499346 [Infundibulicybe gibba]|nr:hypothetical protein BD779DRAFT_1499346 [Infundibulicybe gibba]
MPSSSRRKPRRQVSSDIEDEKTPIHTQEQVDNEDETIEQPRSRSAAARVKREKKPMKNTEQDSESDEAPAAEMDADDDERIDVENFRNQPLRRADLSKLQGLSSDWLHMKKKIRQNWGVIGDVAVSMAETAEGDDGEKALTVLDRMMKDLIDIEAEMEAHELCIDDIHQKVAQGEEIDNVVDRYQIGVEKGMKVYAKKTTRQKYAKNEQYAQFRANIYEVQHPDQAMPPITDFIPKENGDNSDDDDDLEIGGVTQNYLCPITLTPLVNPVTSQVCGHSFSAEAIRATFKGSRDPKKCPASGCNQSFTLSDCKANKDMAKKVKAWQRRAERTEEHSDAEEIVE